MSIATRIFRLLELVLIYLTTLLLVVKAFTFENSPPNIDGITYDLRRQMEYQCAKEYLIVVISLLLLAGFLIWRIVKPNLILRILSALEVLTIIVIFILIYGFRMFSLPMYHMWAPPYYMN
jgi:hypothetical protein